MTPVAEIVKRAMADQLTRTLDTQKMSTDILLALRKQIIGEIAAEGADTFSSYRQQQILRDMDRYLTTAGNSLQTEIGNRITASAEAARTLLPEMAAAGSGITLSGVGLTSSVLDQIKEFAWGRVTAVTNDVQAKIRAELTMGLLGQKTPQQIASAIAGNLESPGVFKNIPERAETIVKIEMGRSFSMASQRSFESATESLPDLKKMWLHAGRPKTPRPYHLAINGTVKPVNEKFLLGNIAMMYPRDPKAPISEVVGCGCMHVAYMDEWGPAKDFTTAWEVAQKSANKRR